MSHLWVAGAGDIQSAELEPHTGRNLGHRQRLDGFVGVLKQSAVKPTKAGDVGLDPLAQTQTPVASIAAIPSALVEHLHSLIAFAAHDLSAAFAAFMLDSGDRSSHRVNVRSVEVAITGVVTHDVVCPVNRSRHCRHAGPSVPQTFARSGVAGSSVSPVVCINY